MMFTKSYARISFLLILTIIVLLSPSLIRDSDTYIGEDPYFYSRVSKILENDILYDELSYSGRLFTYPLGQSVIFLFFSQFLPEQIIFRWIPILFGLISLILFYLILKEFYMGPNQRYLSLIVLILSPPFIYIFGSYTSFTSITLIVLLTVYLFIKKNYILNFISYALFFIIPFFGYQYLILVLLPALIYCIKEKKIKRFYILLSIGLVSLAFIYLPNLIKYGFSESPEFIKPLIYNLFSDLGGSFGISIFVLFLSFFGLSHLWKLKYKYLPTYLTLIVLIVLTFYFQSFIVYLNFILSVLAALGIINLLRSKWESETIRKLTIWLLVIGLIFSTTIFLKENSISQPNQNLHDALIALNNYDSSNSVVFSHYSYGVFINAIANKKNIMDSNFFYAPNLNERYNDSQTLFYTRDFNVAFDLTDKYNIEYILVTKEMRQGLVWEQEDEGLLFLLESVNIYKKIYYNDRVEIWRIKE